MYDRLRARPLVAVLALLSAAAFLAPRAAADPPATIVPEISEVFEVGLDDAYQDWAPGEEHADQRLAAILPLIRPIDAFLSRNETGGVTLDPRSLGIPAEVIRLSVVPQLLGYCELYRAFPTRRHHQDIVERADWLLAHLDAAVGGSSSDGMLALALLEAHAITGDPRYRAAVAPLRLRFLGLSGFDARLNWGLMAALALAESYRQTGDAEALAKVRQLVAGLAVWQHPDGSWPHICIGSRDVHYTAWMTQELILIRERIGTDPNLERVLARAYAFLSGRVDAAGMTHYQQLGALGTSYFFSRATGCLADYDTRGWNNELGYHAVLFDHFGDARLQPILRTLRERQDEGAYADKWDYLPAVSDPIYGWASEPHSVMRTSVIFWSLASLEPVKRRGRGRPLAGARPAITGLAEAGSAPVKPESDATLELAVGPIAPNPATAGCGIALRLPEAATVVMDVLDATGRRVRAIDLGRLAAGPQRGWWDGRDATGRPASPGLYLIAVRAAGRQAVARVAITR